mgnify:CR=1 FL=1
MLKIFKKDHILKNSIQKILISNILVFLVTIILIEIFFGYWFKNKLENKLSSERNIYRVYETNFEYLKNSSLYIKNNFGFRVKNLKEDISFPDIVIVGGSTVNQKFLNYDETVVGILKKNISNYKILNAGVDGMSIKGHINSFEMWFDKMNELKPKYYIFLIGINDRYMVETFKFRDYIDNLEESDNKSNIREYLESNSFFFVKGRIAKSVLYLKYGINLGIKKVKKNHVYIERDKLEFISHADRKKEYQFLDKKDKHKYEKFKLWYLNQLNKLTKKVQERGSIPIFINQTTGYGQSFESLIVAETIINHCNKKKIKCIDVARNLSLEYEDFYDESHLNISGSKKLANYILSELNNL